MNNGQNPTRPCQILSLHKCLSISPCLTIQRKQLRPTHIRSSKYEKWKVFSFHLDIAISRWSRRGESTKTGWTTKTVLSTSPSPSMPDSATHRCQKKSHTNYHILSKKREQGSTRTKIWWMKSHPFPDRCQDAKFSEILDLNLETYHVCIAFYWYFTAQQTQLMCVTITQWKEDLHTA